MNPLALGYSPADAGRMNGRNGRFIYDPDFPGALQRRVGFWGRGGLRVEYQIEMSTLDLWISPQAGKSTDIAYRNFSNRDDHLSLFDFIFFPYLLAEHYQRCDYDPLHTVLHYSGVPGGLRLHLAQHPDFPAVILWTDAPTAIDLKSSRHAHAMERAPQVLALQIPERGETIAVCAKLGDGDGQFLYPVVYWEHRSTHARVELQPNQLLVIAGELASEDVAGLAGQLAAWTPEKLLVSARQAAALTLDAGRLELRNFPAQAEHARILDINRKSQYTTQDASGALRDGPKAIYTLLWVRAGMSGPLMAQTGWTDYLRRWCEFILDNPTVIRGEQPEGRMFGQLVGPNNRWEEDGLFYAAWSAWSYYSQTGDGQFIRGGRLDVLLDALDWLERYCWDEQRGLFGRYFCCESAFAGSRDDGWDLASGVKVDWPPPNYNGRVIRRAYDVYINLLNYSVYRMLATATEGAQRQRLLDRAGRIAAAIQPLFTGRDLPLYGILLDEHGQEFPAAPFDVDATDYIWGLTAPPFTPPWLDRDQIAGHLRKWVFDKWEKHERHFTFTYTWPFLASDPAVCGAEPVVKFLELARPQITPPGKYQCMEFGVPEFFFADPENVFHDLKPCGFSVGQYLPLYTHLGLVRQAWGLAVRPAPQLAAIRDFPYRGATLDIEFADTQTPVGLYVDGQYVPGSWQLPDELFRANDRQRIEVKPHADAGRLPCLIGSDAALLGVRREAGALSYSLRGVGPHTLRFRGNIGTPTAVTAAGQPVSVALRPGVGGLTLVLLDLPSEPVTLRILIP